MERKAAIVTGGGTGLGRAVVESLVDIGIDVVIGGRRRDKLDEVVAALEDRPGKVVPTTCDITSTEDRQSLADLCRSEFGRIDILVNNAGTSHEAPILDFDEEGWRMVMATNLDAPFFMSLNVMPDMRERGWGRIINIGSVYGSLAFNARLYGADFRPMTTPGDRGPVRAPAYHVSKAGLLNVTRELAVACSDWGITVNTVSPGMFPLKEIDPNDDSRDALRLMTPMQRFGRPPELAAVVRFVASDESSFMTGSELTVDGGWTIW